ncbi:MAG: hypothetical protein ACK52I_09035 [Pseudomonadota bacterium]
MRGTIVDGAVAVESEMKAPNYVPGTPGAIAFRGATEKSRDNCR